MQVLEHGARGVVGAEHGAGQSEQRLRLACASGREGGAAGGDVDDARHAHRDQDEQQQREQVARLLDGERVQRRREEPVQAQARRRGGEHGRPEPADHGDRDDREEIDQQVVGEVQVVLQRRRARGSGAVRRDDRDDDAEPAAASVDRGDQVRDRRSPRLAAPRSSVLDHVLQCDPKSA